MRDAAHDLLTWYDQHARDLPWRVAPAARAAALAVASGLQPRHTGLQPRFRGLEIEGVSVTEHARGTTLRIDDNLLFASGEAALTAGGGAVLQRLVGRFATFAGEISVEGHTDGLPIATAVQTHPVCLSNGRRDWADATQLGQGGFGMDALGVVSHEDQHLRYGHCGDAMRFHQLGCFLPDQSVKLLVVCLDFFMQSKPAPRNCSHSHFGGCDWGSDLAWPQGCNMAHQSDPSSDPIERVTKICWRIYDQRFQRDHRLRLGFYRAVSRNLQMADHLR